MKKIIAFSLLGLIAVLSSCGDSATEITGTLPIVTDVAIDTLASKGDSIYVTWTAIDTTLVDGYFLWTRPTIDGNWTLVSTYERNAGMAIANTSAFYAVMAFNGTNNSSDISVSANTKTDAISQIREIFQLKPVGFKIDFEGDSLIAGDPSSPIFQQDFVVAINWLGERFIFPGTANPDIWPGGARTKVSSIPGFVAPAPEDSVNWNDSISFGGEFFLALDNGYYCMLKATHTFPDTAAMSDTVVFSGQVQPILGVRVFNE